MHGVFLVKLGSYAQQRLGPGGWERVVAEVDPTHPFYGATQAYPDELVHALIAGLARHAGVSTEELLEGFGEFIAPHLIQMYRPLVKQDWKALDLLENTERVIHTVVRMRMPDAKPAELRPRRISKDELHLEYVSPRQMCSLASGIIQGVAKQYGERLVTTHPSCARKGAPSCTFIVKRA
jgi:hypothetical protein